MAKWDLTSIIGKYLDRHLVFPIVEFLSVNQIYDENEIIFGNYEMVKNTSMVDYAMDIFKILYPDESFPKELTDKRIKVLEHLNKYTVETEHLRNILLSEEAREAIATTRDGKTLLDYLVKKFGFNIEIMDSVYLFAKSQYETGNYALALEYLYLFRLLVPPSDKNYLNVMWGKLAAEILMRNWDSALDDFNCLKEYFDSNPFPTALVTLSQRTWLIHWGLFVFFNHAKGQDLIIDMLLYQTQYLNVIQTICPHVLRYLTAAVVINKRRSSVMKDLVKVIQQESHAYKDPITEFVECLYVNFDFDGAQQKLRECEEVLKNDFFLVSCSEAFVENARLAIFETLFSISECLSIVMLGEKLNMSPEEAEKWIVNLIRNARLDAKIDSKLGHVVMGANTVPAYQKFVETTKILSQRIQMMSINLEKLSAANHPEQVLYGGAQEY